MIIFRALLALAITAAPVLAQGRIVDEGTFIITKAGAPTQTESFRILRSDDGLYRATGQLVAGTRRVTSRLTADSLGTPIEYGVDVRDNGAPTMNISAVSHAGRLSTRAQLSHGDESMREYPVSPGHCLIVEDELLHQMFFAALNRRPGTIQVINPRAAHSDAATLSALGLEPITVAGREVTATHYALGSASNRRDFWVDANGRVLAVDVPGLGIKASREELPR